MSATCPKCKRVTHGVSTSPIHFVPNTKCSNPRCDHVFQVEQPQQMMTCGCCGGTGHYDPLQGPREPCGTCKGEKVVPVPSDKVPNLFEHQRAAIEQFTNPSLGQVWVPGDTVGHARMRALEYINNAGDANERRKRKSEAFGVMYGADPATIRQRIEENTVRKELTAEEKGRLEGLTYAQGMTFGEMYGDYIRRQDFNFAQFMSNYPFEQRQSEGRVHRVGNVSGDIQLKFGIPQGTPEFEASCKRVEVLLRKLTAHIMKMGGWIEAGQASLGQFRAALDPGHPSFAAYINGPNEDEEDDEEDDFDDDIDFDEDSDDFDDDDDDFDDSDSDFDAKAAIDGGAVKMVTAAEKIAKSPMWASLREKFLADYAERDAADALRMSAVAAGLLTGRQVHFASTGRQEGKTFGLKEMVRAMGVKAHDESSPVDIKITPRYRIIDFHDNADFANIERVMAEKAAIMSPGTPVYYDPETGAIAPRKP